MDVRTRRALLTDYTAVRDTIAASMATAFRGFMPPLERAAYLRHWATPERFQRELADPRDLNLVAECDGRIVGVGSAEHRGTYAEVWRLYVRPEAWRHGVGRLLWDELIEWARVQRLSRVHLDTFADAQGSQQFYRALGCTPGEVRTAILVDGSRHKVRLREYSASLAGVLVPA